MLYAQAVRIEKKSRPELGFFPFSAVAFSALRQDVFVLAARRKRFAAKKSRFVRLRMTGKAGEMLLCGSSPAHFLTLGFLFHKFRIVYLSGKTLWHVIFDSVFPMPVPFCHSGLQLFTFGTDSPVMALSSFFYNAKTKCGN